MFLSLQVFAFERQNMTFTVNELLTCFINCDAGPGEIVTRRSRISANSLWVLLPYPNWFFLSFQEWQTDCLTHNFTRRSVRGGRPVFRFGGMIRMTNQSTTNRGIPEKSPKTDFMIPYLPSESIFKSKHEKTVQMETDFSAAKTRNSHSDFLGLRNYKATAMHHGKWQWVFKLMMWLVFNSSSNLLT